MLRHNNTRHDFLPIRNYNEPISGPESYISFCCRRYISNIRFSYGTTNRPRNPGVAIPIRISAHNNRRQASFKDHPADIGFRYIFSVNISIPLFHEIDSFVSFGTTSASPIIGAARGDQSDQPCDGNRRIVMRSRFKQGRCLYRLFDQIPLNCRRRDYVRGPVIVKFIISQQLRNGYRRATSWISTITGTRMLYGLDCPHFCF